MPWFHVKRVDGYIPISLLFLASCLVFFSFLVLFIFTGGLQKCYHTKSRDVFGELVANLILQRSLEERLGVLQAHESGWISSCQNSEPKPSWPEMTFDVPFQVPISSLLIPRHHHLFPGSTRVRITPGYVSKQGHPLNWAVSSWFQFETKSKATPNQHSSHTHTHTHTGCPSDPVKRFSNKPKVLAMRLTWLPFA